MPDPVAKRDMLALRGGEPVLRSPLRPYASMGPGELEAVSRVIQSGCLSGFYGSPGDQFLGGPMVRALEREWSERFGVAHAVSVNSGTSGLFAAMGALGIRPGDEVIVPPYTMSATAMAPLVYGGIPVFADIDPDTFCLDPQAVRRAVTPRTKAILAVNLFGHPAPLAELRTLADEHGIRLIEDNAQGPLASENERHAGTVGDIGVFSLNYHKHVHCGEGGVCVTNDDTLALRLQMIRNHGENLADAAPDSDAANIIGFNYRMTELSAAVAREQLRDIDEHVSRRERAATALSDGVRGLEGLTVPHVRSGCRHVYYVWALRLDEAALGINRAQFSAALAAEGVPHATGYVRPLYHLPIFRSRTASGSPSQGLCPVAERMHERELLVFEPCAYDLDAATVDLLVSAFRKVYAQRDMAAFVPAPARHS